MNLKAISTSTLVKELSTRDEVNILTGKDEIVIDGLHIKDAGTVILQIYINDVTEVL